MAYRSPRLRWLIPVGGAAVLATLGFGLWRGSDVKAPETPGACWLLSGERSFVRLATPAADLDACAAGLEYERLRRGRDVTGAFQGRFIFADGDMLGSGDSLHGMRWRMFFDPQRADLDSKLLGRLNQERALAVVRADVAGVSRARLAAAPAP